MKTQREVEMLGLRPYGDFIAGRDNLDQIYSHIRRQVAAVSHSFANSFGGYTVLVDVFGNLYFFMVIERGLFLTKLDDGAATIIKEIGE